MAICAGKKSVQMMYSPMYPPPGMPLIATELNTATSRILTMSPAPSNGMPNTPKRNAIFSTQLKHEPSMCIVAPSGRTRSEMSRGTPLSSAASKFVGIVATDEQVPSAVTAGRRICRRMTRTPSFPPPR